MWHQWQTETSEWLRLILSRLFPPRFLKTLNNNILSAQSFDTWCSDPFSRHPKLYPASWGRATCSLLACPSTSTSPLVASISWPPMANRSVGKVSATLTFFMFSSFVKFYFSQIIANHHMQSISFASGGDPVSYSQIHRFIKEITVSLPCYLFMVLVFFFFLRTQQITLPM